MARVNLFAEINGSLPPLIPKPEHQPPPASMVWAPLSSQPDMGPLQNLLQPQAKSSVWAPVDPQQGSAPSSSRPSVWARVPAQQREEGMLTRRLDQDYEKDLHPWGTEDNHPGVWGKIGHALSVATGGPNRRLQEEQGLEGRLNTLATLQQENALRDAETEEATARAYVLENPPPQETKPPEAAHTVITDKGILQWNPATEPKLVPDRVLFSPA